MMLMLLEIYYKFIMQKGIFDKGWRRYTLYPFVRLLYILRVLVLTRLYIKRPNKFLPFRELVLDYVSFLNVLKNMLHDNPDMENVNLAGENTTIYSICYTDNNALKSIDYIYTEEFYSGPIKIKITMNEPLSTMLIDIESTWGITSFSYNTLIDSRMLKLKNNVETIIRNDISKNLKWLLLRKII